MPEVLAPPPLERLRGPAPARLSGQIRVRRGRPCM